MSVINELLNTQSQEATQRKIMYIDIDEIQPNPLNRAPMIYMDELEAAVRENGLQTPLQVYKKSNHQYMLINGERRYRVLKRIGTKTVPAIVIDKPNNRSHERMLILDANAQREEPPEYKHLRAKEYEEIYYVLKNENKIPAGMLKIEWIGNHMGVSGRTVQRYLTSSEENKKVIKLPCKRDLLFQDLQDHIQSRLQTRVKFKKNAFTISYSDEEDLNRILEILHLENIVNE